MAGTIGGYIAPQGGGGTGGGGGGNPLTASGSTATRATFLGPFFVGTSWQARSAEPISGIRAVALSQSGTIQIAMASLQSRMPAIGAVFENVASGAFVNVYTDGVFQAGADGLLDYSGFVGQTVYVGRSGQMITESGAFNSGGFMSGDFWQPLGHPWNSGGVILNLAASPLTQLEPLQSGNIGSGQVGTYHLSSGATIDRTQYVTFFTSGIGRFGSIITGETISGVRAVFVTQSGRLEIAKASVSGKMPAVGVVVDNVASGIQAHVYSVGTFLPSVSGLVDCSGQLGRTLFVGRSGQVVTASGSFNSGGLLSGDVTQVVGVAVASGVFGVSMAVREQFVVGQITSGNVASGQISWPHIASGSIRSGLVGDAAINTIAFASGATPTRTNFIAPFASGTSWQMITEEVVSGIRAVQISQSGTLRIAKAAVSGFMPAVGIVVENVLSGINANVYTQGVFQFASGLVDFSGRIGRVAWVGRSGQVVCQSGAWNSGGFLSGDLGQVLGTVWNSGGLVANIHPLATSGDLVSILGPV